MFAVFLSTHGRVAVTLERCSGPKHQMLWVTFTVDRSKQTKHGPKESEFTTRQILWCGTRAGDTAKAMSGNAVLSQTRGHFRIRVLAEIPDTRDNCTQPTVAVRRLKVDCPDDENKFDLQL